MRAAAERFEAALLTNADVLISGEAGIGRELMARAIHRASSEGQRGTIGQLLCEKTRSFVGDRPFVDVDCSSTADLETALFGLPPASRTASAGRDTALRLQARPRWSAARRGASRAGSLTASAGTEGARRDPSHHRA
ncbi:MAG: hypothetical protein EXQ48_03900 [Acidobacteria bacterium]|nr:hypothetical protein [Acidobacteriota bacterium]